MNGKDFLVSVSVGSFSGQILAFLPLKGKYVNHSISTLAKTSPYIPFGIALTTSAASFAINYWLDKDYFTDPLQNKTIKEFTHLAIATLSGSIVTSLFAGAIALSTNASFSFFSTIIAGGAAGIIIHLASRIALFVKDFFIKSKNPVNVVGVVAQIRKELEEIEKKIDERQYDPRISLINDPKISIDPQFTPDNALDLTCLTLSKETDGRVKATYKFNIEGIETLRVNDDIRGDIHYKEVMRVIHNGEEDPASFFDEEVRRLNRMSIVFPSSLQLLTGPIRTEVRGQSTQHIYPPMITGPLGKEIKEVEQLIEAKIKYNAEQAKIWREIQKDRIGKNNDE